MRGAGGQRGPRCISRAEGSGTSSSIVRGGHQLARFVSALYSGGSEPEMELPLHPLTRHVRGEVREGRDAGCGWVEREGSGTNSSMVIRRGRGAARWAPAGEILQRAVLVGERSGEGILMKIPGTPRHVRERCERREARGVRWEEREGGGAYLEEAP